LSEATPPVDGPERFASRRDASTPRPMNAKQDIVDQILADAANNPIAEADAFAPANIALCKYWGKRNTELNLPVTSSLSMSLGELGSRCRISLRDDVDEIILNGTPLAPDSPFSTRASRYLDLFRKTTGCYYRLDTTNTIPTAAGFASSASGFASLVLALNTLHGWDLPDSALSILARLGSGSACRSLWQGFVEWHAGRAPDGSDCYAEPLDAEWPELRIGLLVLEAGKKPIGSREAMQRTVETSALYRAWPGKVATDLRTLRKAIEARDIELLGATAESNALSMHATMMAAIPPVLYWLPASITTMQSIWQCRREGLPVYLTMDAGPNIKLLFLSEHKTAVQERFPDILIA
jgi:diphosphomevalonate decarboxylase